MVVALWFLFGANSCSAKCVMLLERNAGQSWLAGQGVLLVKPNDLRFGECFSANLEKSSINQESG